MKKFAAAAGLAFVIAGAPAMAGGMATEMDRTVVVDDTGSSSGGILVPILALIMIGAALAD